MTDSDRFRLTSIWFVVCFLVGQSIGGCTAHKELLDRVKRIERVVCPEEPK